MSDSRRIIETRTKIYVLTDFKGQIRYVGKTVKSLKHRLCQHLSAKVDKKRSHKINWINSLLRRGTLPEIKLLEEVKGNGCQEEISWIAHFKSIGVKLVNATIGGEGASGFKFSEASRKRLSQAHKGQKPSRETLEKRSKALKGKNKPKGFGKRLSRILKGRKRSKESCEKMSIAHKGKRLSKETRQKISEANKGKHNLSADHRQKLRIANLGRHLSDEVRRKISESRKGQKGHPCSLETKLKISRANKGRLPWCAGKKLSPEFCQKIKESWEKRKKKVPMGNHNGC